MKLSDFKSVLRQKQSEQKSEGKAPSPVNTPEKPSAPPSGVAAASGSGRLSALPDPERMMPDRITLARIGLALALILVSVLVKSLPHSAVFALRLAAAAGVGYDIAWSTVNDVRNRAYTCDGLPVIIAVILAFANGMSLEAAVAITVLQVALWLRSYTYHKTRSALNSIISLPGFAYDLSVGDTFKLEAGEPVPADCAIVQGAVTVDLCSALGKRTERPMKSGEMIPAGCKILGGSALAEALRPAKISETSRISEAIAGGCDGVTRTERAVNKYAFYLMPALLALSVILLIALPLATDMAFGESLRRVLTIIVVSAPCGVLVSLPLASLAGMVKQRGRGFVFLSAEALDGVAYTKAVVLEKTGTVTTDALSVSEMSLDKMDPETFLKVAAHAASRSSSPIARAVTAAYGSPVSDEMISSFFEYPGWGVSVMVNGISILLGTSEFMAKNLIQAESRAASDCTVYMAISGILAGSLSLDHMVDPSVKGTVEELTKIGVDRVVMLSGGGRKSESVTAQNLGISEYYAECSERDKVRNITELRSRVDSKGLITYVCGMRGSAKVADSADIAVVVNCLEASALEGSADILLLGQPVTRLPEVVTAGRRARRVALIFAASGLLVKLLIVALACAGLAPLWFGILLDTCASLALIRTTFSLWRFQKPS